MCFGGHEEEQIFNGYQLVEKLGNLTLENGQHIVKFKPWFSNMCVWSKWKWCTDVQSEGKSTVSRKSKI